MEIEADFCTVHSLSIPFNLLTMKTMLFLFYLFNLWLDYWTWLELFFKISSSIPNKTALVYQNTRVTQKRSNLNVNLKLCYTLLLWRLRCFIRLDIQQSFIRAVELSTINYKIPPSIHVMSSLTWNPLSEIPNQTILAPFSLFSGNRSLNTFIIVNRIFSYKELVTFVNN